MGKGLDHFKLRMRPVILIGSICLAFSSLMVGLLANTFDTRCMGWLTFGVMMFCLTNTFSIIDLENKN